MSKSKKEAAKVEPIYRVPVKSSMIAEMGHDGNQTLEIKFIKGGKVFRYTPVDKDLYTQLLNAPSHGGFFYSNIRSNSMITFEQILQ